MNNADTQTSAQYKKVRDAFAELDTQDKTAFVLEATFSTIGTALSEASQRVSEVFEHVTSEDFWSNFERAEDDEADESPKARSSTRKKSTTKKSSTRKRSTKNDDDA